MPLPFPFLPNHYVGLNNKLHNGLSMGFWPWGHVSVSSLSIAGSDVLQFEGEVNQMRRDMSPLSWFSVFSCVGNVEGRILRQCTWKLRFCCLTTLGLFLGLAVAVPAEKSYGIWGFACLLLKSFCIEYCIVHMQPHLPWPSVVKGSWDDPQLVLFAYPNRLISSPEQSEEWQLFNPLFTLHGRAVFDAGCWIVAVARFEVSTQTLGDLFQSMFSPFFCGFSQVMLGLCGFRFSQFWLNHVG